MISKGVEQLSLTELYNLVSKHSNYQALARPLRAFLNENDLHTRSRSELERFDYILPRCDMRGKTIVDIGGNTGFFTFECAAQGAASVLYFDGDQIHANFVREATRLLRLDAVVKVVPVYMDFRKCFTPCADICLVLNVLHHVGDDFDPSVVSKEHAKWEILDALSRLAQSTRLLVFQMGFNWKGDRNLPLFDRGTKAEMIDFVRQGTAADWEIVNIGVASRDQKVEYVELSETTLGRDDALGEFLNRPLFIMRSKRLSNEAAARPTAVPPYLS